MNKKIVEQKLKEITEKIVKEYQPEKVILFGSFAWGKPHEDSDFDLFIIKDTDVPSLKRIEMLDRIFSRREFSMDFLVYTPKQVKRNLRTGDLFVRDILTNGKILYEAKVAK